MIDTYRFGIMPAAVLAAVLAAVSAAKSIQVYTGIEGTKSIKSIESSSSNREILKILRKFLFKGRNGQTV